MSNIYNAIHPNPFSDDLPDFDYLATLVPGRAVDVTETVIPRRGMFDLTADNSKKRGKMQPVRTIVCEGTLYSSGHISLDTVELPVRDFLSLAQMESYLAGWGNYTLLWLEAKS
jgi:hypothetical protein